MDDEVILMIAFLDIDFSGMINGLENALETGVRNLVGWVWTQVQSFLVFVWGLLPHQLPWPPGAPTPGDGLMYLLGNGTDAHPYTAIWSALQAANFYSPVDLAIVLLCLMVGQEVIMGLWKGLRWLLTKLPWVGGAA